MNTKNQEDSTRDRGASRAPAPRPPRRALPALLVGALLLALPACEPCESLSGQEVCDQVLSAVTAACGATTCEAFLQPAAGQQDRPSCFSTDRFCRADLERSLERMASATTCQQLYEAYWVGCFPE